MDPFEVKVLLDMGFREFVNSHTVVYQPKGREGGEVVRGCG